MTSAKPAPPPRPEEEPGEGAIEPGDLVIELGEDGVPRVYTEPER